MTDASEDGVWVLSDVAPDGQAYVPTIQLGADRTFIPKDPVAYALAVIQAAQYAAYDAAVLAQMTKVTEGKRELAARIVMGTREDRPPVDDAATAPLTYSPIVSHRNGRPYVQVQVDGENLTQWTPADAMHHALGVLAVSAVVDLDGAYYCYLVIQIGLEPSVAKAAIHDLASHRHEEERE